MSMDQAEKTDAGKPDAANREAAAVTQSDNFLRPAYSAAGSWLRREWQLLKADPGTGGWLALIGGLLIVQALAQFAAVLTFTGGNEPALLTSALHAAALMTGGLLFALILPRKITASARSLLILVFVGGLAMRLLAFWGHPFLEDDFYRYLWDGALTANGFNPYEIAPRTFLQPWLDELASVAPYAPLVDAGRTTLENVNHPWLTTIYPSTAQAFFALAYTVDPFSLAGWRAVLVLTDVIAFLLLLRLLQRLNIPLAWSALYWLNPLVIGMGVHAAHMDLLLAPFLIGFALLLTGRWYRLAAAVLALAAAIKIWPVLLLPLLLRLALKISWQRASAVLLTFTALTAALFFPMLMHGLGNETGLGAYSRVWQMNDSGYQIVHALAERLTAFWLPGADIGLAETRSHQLARLAVAGLTGLTALAITLRLPSAEAAGAQRILIRRIGIVILTLLLLSPTQFPWYFLWFMPFLPVLQWRGALTVVPLLSLYALRPLMLEYEVGRFYDTWLVWLIFLPVWALITADVFRHFRRGTRTADGPQTA